MVSFLHKNEHGLREQPVLFFLVVLFFDLDNVSTEGTESKLHHFECLQTEGNADDSDAADHAANEVSQSQLPAEKNGPKKVGDGVLFKLYSDLLAKGGEGQLSCLEALHAKGNADDGNAQQHTEQKPGKTKPDSAENEP